MAKLCVWPGPDDVTFTEPSPAIVCSCAWLNVTVCECPESAEVAYVAPLAGGLVRSLSGTQTVWM